jgi:ligand-binding sensor domain-containing protein
MRPRAALGPAFAAVALLAAAPAAALEPGPAITQYVRETWIAKDGAPAGTITGITQTPNGYLWLGTEGDGLVRFDGVRFVRDESLDTVFGRRVDRVTSLLTGRDGTLWVGTGHGLARQRQGVWTAFDRGEAKDVYGLHEAADGSIWYARHWDGIFHVERDVLTFEALRGLPRFVTSDRDGTLWVGGYQGLWRIRGAEKRFYGEKDGLLDQNVTSVHADPDGRVFVGSQLGLMVMRGDEVAERFDRRNGLSNDEISVTYGDRDGNLWIGTVNGGLNRRVGDRFESLTRSAGLTHNRVTSIYEDREGSLWVGTAAGLNRLRDVSVLPIGDTEGLSPREPLSIVETRDGGVAVSAGFDGVNWIADGRIRIESPRTVPNSNFDAALYADPDGGLWSTHRNGLSYRKDGRGTLYPAPGFVSAVTRDARGIVFAVEGDIYRLVSGKAERYRLPDGSAVGHEKFGFDYVWMLLVSQDGTLWMATTRGVFTVKDGEAKAVWQPGPLSARSLSEDENGTVWIGSMGGLLRVKGGALSILTSKHGLAEDDVHFAISDRQGGLWMTGARGISRADLKAVEEVADGKAARFAVRRFGVEDGMRTAVATAIYQPAVLLSRDGRLWFTTTGGIVTIDSPRIQRNALPPPVVVEGIQADDRPLDPGLDLQVPAGTERLAIFYNGLSLLIPQRVRFKYRLEGYDRDWVDARDRRAAYYTRLPPGRYRFRVLAANNDGVWSEVPASAEFRMLPRFYQTTWFSWGVTLAVIAAVVAAYLLRVRTLKRVEQELQERITEALTRIKTLSGLLPICAWCKKVRDDTGYWSQIEIYVREHTEADFTHGICPDCVNHVRANPEYRPPAARD